MASRPRSLGPSLVVSYKDAGILSFPKGETPVAPARCSLLIVDDEPYILSTLVGLLNQEYEILTANSVESAQQILVRRSVDLVLTDQRMPQASGVELLEWVHQHCPRTVRLLMSGNADLEDAVEAINRGQVYYYLLKPWRTDELRQVLRNAAEKFVLEQRHNALLSQLEERVAARTRELEQANQLLQQRARELERLILLDPLTGLFNRRAMTDLGIAELKRHNRYHHPLTIGLLDVDLFKQINTDYTLTGGDEVLRQIGTDSDVDPTGSRFPGPHRR